MLVSWTTRDDRQEGSVREGERGRMRRPRVLEDDFVSHGDDDVMGRARSEIEG